MCKRTDLAAPDSNAEAVRRPEPVMTSTIARPLTHPGRFTISWMIGEMSGERCAAPASPMLIQGAGTQGTDAAVRGRDETLRLVVVKVPGLSAACPWMVSDVASDPVSSVWNCR